MRGVMGIERVGCVRRGGAACLRVYLTLGTVRHKLPMYGYHMFMVSFVACVSPLAPRARVGL